MALGDLDDDSFHENPPKLSYNLDQDDDGFENSRRALLYPRDRRSLGSFGDPSFADLNELGMDDSEERETRRLALEEEMMMEEDDMDDLDVEYGLLDATHEQWLITYSGETGELRALMESRRQSRRSEVIGASSSPGTTGEPTFLFRIPERSRHSLLRPEIEQEDEIEDEAGEELAQAELDRGGDVGPDFDDDGYEDIDGEEAAAPLRGESLVPAERQAQPRANKTAKRTRKELKLSQFGIEYPSLPPTVIKRLASTFARSYGGSGKLNKETIAAISQTSDWFFEQVSEDLASYADHAGRKTIDEADVVTIMKRYVLHQIDSVVQR
jgi:histone H3/H4